MTTEDLLNDGGEVVVPLADGCSLRSGVYKNEPGAFTSGEYVRLCDPEGDEILYWDQEEWRLDPALVMGAIINSAAGFRTTNPDPEIHDADCTYPDCFGDCHL